MLLETKIPFGYIIRAVRRDAITVFVITVAVEVLLELSSESVPVVPAAVPAFLGTAISLILSFKLNQSYDRWWEARKIWGAIVNDSRSLVRQALSFVDGTIAGSQEIVARLARRQIAWCYCLGQSLRGQDWKTGAEPHLTAQDLSEAERHANKAVALMQSHARDVARLAADGGLTDYQRVTMDDTLTRLTDSMGKAERIRNTVFPLTYRVFLHAFIYLFIALLSISLGEINGGWQILITNVIAVAFFLLERTATHMQDPFANRPTDTSVTAIARTIEINILQLLGEKDVPEPLRAQGFYIM